MNGCTLTGNATGEGTLYAYDSATDDYDSGDMGRITGTVSCGLPHNFQGSQDTIGSLNRYLTVADDSGYSFHRFYLNITHASMKPSSTGVGYKAEFYGSEAVKNSIASIGYSIQHAEEGDMICIIGKGHEDYQEIEGVRYHFSDREVAEEFLA